MTRVWIDPDECTGAGNCRTIAPQVFQPRGDGTFVVTEDAAFFGETTVFDGVDAPGHGPDGAAGLARVPDSLLADVVDAAQLCPGQCIYLED